MPSYRVVLTVGRVHPGADATAVLPDAAAAVAEVAVVEAKSVGVSDGRGQVTVRFEAEDDEVARQVAPLAAAAASRSAEVLRADLRRRSGSRWPLL